MMQLFPIVLLEYEMVIVYSALRLLQAIYCLISNARS